MDLISSRIFTLTNFGLFQVWDLVSFDVIFSKNFAKKAKYLLSFRLSNKVLIVFENDIVVMDSDPKTNHFDEKADYFLALSNITFACLNCNEQILGVATQSAS
jgi:phosphoribosylaminoimidazole-succinocarboxamide synthase